MTAHYWQVRTREGHRLLWDGRSKSEAERIARTSEYGPCVLVREDWVDSNLDAVVYLEVDV